jgi:hypothetical protein
VETPRPVCLLFVSASRRSSRVAAPPVVAQSSGLRGGGSRGRADWHTCLHHSGVAGTEQQQAAHAAWPPVLAGALHQAAIEAGEPVGRVCSACVLASAAAARKRKRIQ